MPAVLSRPRWLQWEGRCLEAAFEHHVQLKVMAAVFQKSVSAVSKKIEAMGLRKKRGVRKRLRERAPNHLQEDRLLWDYRIMQTLVKRHGPVSYTWPQHLIDISEKLARYVRLNKGRPRQEESVGKLSTEGVPYKMVKPLCYTLLEEEDIALPGVDKDCEHTLYVPFPYIEQWAFLQGFAAVSECVPGRERYYWRHGSYFSQAQLVIYLNTVRSLKHLGPVHLSEKEISDG